MAGRARRRLVAPEVPLELPRVGLLDRGLVERRNCERDILASLEHPSIARLYDAGVDEVGRPDLALEYVEGIPLIATRPSTDCPSRSAPLFILVARAVVSRTRT